MDCARSAVLSLALLLPLIAPAPARAQDRVKTKEIVDRAGGRAAHDAGGHHRRLDHQQHARAHLRPAARPRCQDAQAQAHAGRELADRERHDVGVQAAQGREVPQRRALHGGLGEGHHRLRPRSRHQESLRGRRLLGAGERGAGRRRPHGALRHQAAVAEPHRQRLADQLADHAGQGAQGPGPGQARREADRHRALQVRGVEARRAPGAGAQPRLLAGAGRRQPRHLPLHPGVQRPDGRAALGRDRHHEGRAAPRGGAGGPLGPGQGPRRRVLPHQLPGPGQPQARAHAGPARAAGHEPRGGRGRADQAGAQGPRHPHVRPDGAAQRRLRPGRVLRPRPGARPGPVQGGGDRSQDPLAHAGHARRPVSAGQGRFAGHCRTTSAAGNQDERGRQRVGNSFRQDQEPQHRGHVLPGLGPGAARPGHDAAAVPGRPDLLVLWQQSLLNDKIARASTLLEPKARADAYAELQRLVRDEAPWVFLWQQHDLYGVASYVEWTPRADEKVWMYEAKVVAR